MMAIALPALWRRSHPELAFVASTTSVLVRPRFLPVGAGRAYEISVRVPDHDLLLAPHGEEARAAATIYGVAALSAIDVGELLGTTARCPDRARVSRRRWIGVGRFTSARRRPRAIESARKRRNGDVRGMRAASGAETRRIAREVDHLISHSVSVIVMQAAVERRRRTSTRATREHCGRSSVRDGTRSGAPNPARRALRQRRCSRAPTPAGPPPSCQPSASLRAGLPVELLIEGDAVDRPLPDRALGLPDPPGSFDERGDTPETRAEVVVQYERDRRA